MCIGLFARAVFLSFCLWEKEELGMRQDKSARMDEGWNMRNEMGMT